MAAHPVGPRHPAYAGLAVLPDLHAALEALLSHAERGWLAGKRGTDEGTRALYDVLDSCMRNRNYLAGAGQSTVSVVATSPPSRPPVGERACPMVRPASISTGGPIYGPQSPDRRPARPADGDILLYDKAHCRFFRDKDGLEWLKPERHTKDPLLGEQRGLRGRSAAALLVGAFPNGCVSRAERGQLAAGRGPPAVRLPSDPYQRPASTPFDPHSFQRCRAAAFASEPNPLLPPLLRSAPSRQGPGLLLRLCRQRRARHRGPVPAGERARGLLRSQM